MVAPFALSPNAVDILVARPAKDTGLRVGVFLRDGCTTRHESILAAYWGHMTRHPNPGTHPSASASASSSWPRAAVLRAPPAAAEPASPTLVRPAVSHDSTPSPSTRTLPTPSPTSGLPATGHVSLRECPPAACTMFYTYCLDFRGAVFLAWLALWPRPPGPLDLLSHSTIDNAQDILQHMVRPHCSNWQRLSLTDRSDASPLDRPDGHYEPVVTQLVKATPTRATIPSIIQAFTDMTAPLGTARGTRL